MSMYIFESPASAILVSLVPLASQVMAAILDFHKRQWYAMKS